jgi:hypothetical protein
MPPKLIARDPSGEGGRGWAIALASQVSKDVVTTDIRLIWSGPAG